MSSSDRPAPDDVFPFPSYRPYQRAALHEASHALFESDDITTVVLNLPTGIGKSPINTALARQAESAFLTTPQKALRTQLENDTDLRDHYSVLRAREDYNCPAGSIYASSGENYNCKECPINQDDDDSCLHYPDCTYWNRKQLAMGDPVAVLTFSYLVVDGYLPVMTSAGDSNESSGSGGSSSDGGSDLTQVSFDNRELLVVDECHKLEDQVASLHAGITISPYSLPMEVFQQVDREIGELPPFEVTKFEDVREYTDRVYDRAQSYIEEHSASPILGEEESSEVQQCKGFSRKYAWCREQVLDGRDWVIDREEVNYNGNIRYSITVQPVDVDEFLQEHIWSRAENHVLSTATMPYSSQPEKWIRRLGLDEETTKVVQYPMPFPAEHRPIHTDSVVAKMSQGGYDRHRDSVVEKLRYLSRQHAGEKGLIHTASYKRARDLHREFHHNSLCHEKAGDVDLGIQIEHWQKSDKDLFFSPAATDGVDLPGEMCRWQALVKVPYPQPGNPRVRFMLDERDAWDWYYETTSQDVRQSVGRGVRSMDDHCDFYALDASFLDVMKRADIPDWFGEAIQTS